MAFNPNHVRDDAGQYYLPVADAQAIVVGEPLVWDATNARVRPVNAAVDNAALIGVAAQAKVASDGTVLLLVEAAGEDQVRIVSVDSATWSVGDTFKWKSVASGLHQFEKSSLTPMAVAVEAAASAATVAKVKFLRGINIIPTDAGNSIGASTAAAGTTEADAGILPAATARIYPTTAADDTKGVKVNAADQVTGRLLLIGNGVSNKILKVYGPTGAVINGAAANAAFLSASGKGVIMVCLSGTGNTWLAW